MKSVTIIGVDPGVTTGVAVVRHNLPVDNPHEPYDWECYQYSYGGSGNVTDLIEGDQSFIEQKIVDKIANHVYDAVSDTDYVILAIEDFIIRRVDSSRDFLSPVRITAGLLQKVYKEPIKIVFQQPSAAKTTCTNERMDKWGFTIKTQKDRHARDALRHAILTSRRLKENPRKHLPHFSQ